MKKALTLIIASFITLVGLQAQLVLTPSDSIHVDTSLFASSHIAETKTYLRNTGTEAITVNWNAYRKTADAAWFTSLCDKAACYDVTSVTAGSYSLDPGESSIMKGWFQPNLVAGNGHLTVAMWSGTDSIIAEYTTNITIATPPTGIESKEVSHSITVFPNPVADVVSIEIEGDVINGSVAIYSILGDRVASETISTAGTTNIDVSNYDAGLYLVKIADNNSGKVYTKTFKKS